MKQTNEAYERELNYNYLITPTKVNLFLTGNERNLFNLLFSLKRMKNKDEIDLSYSYICQNLDVADKTAQKLIKRLIELDLITKSSNTQKGLSNLYEINMAKVEELDKKSKDEIFSLRKQLKPRNRVNSKSVMATAEYDEYEQYDPELDEEYLMRMGKNKYRNTDINSYWN